MRTRRRKGGGVLGKGLSGTVIYPAIPCKDGRDLTDYVSRIVGKRKRNNPMVDLVSNNRILVEKLKKVDPKQKFLLYPETCEPGDLLDENVADGVTEKTKNLSELYKRAGITWEHYCKTNVPTDKQVNHVLKAIKKLHEAGILHGDFKSNNIVLAADNLPRLIDFGSSVYDCPQDLIDMEDELVEKTTPSFSKSLAKKLHAILNKKRYFVMLPQKGD